VSFVQHEIVELVNKLLLPRSNVLQKTTTLVLSTRAIYGLGSDVHELY